MEFHNVFGFKLKWNSVCFLMFLVVSPNLLGMINLPTIWGFKIHLFQYLVFVAAVIYGPLGGMLVGGFGSFYTSMVLANPYIIVGNMMLGFFTAYFYRKGMHVSGAAMTAWAIQTPWLWVTDVYLIGMSPTLVSKIIIALCASNLVWSSIASKTHEKFRDVLL